MYRAVEYCNDCKLYWFLYLNKFCTVLTVQHNMRLAVCPIAFKYSETLILYIKEEQDPKRHLTPQLGHRQESIVRYCPFLSYSRYCTFSLPLSTGSWSRVSSLSPSRHCLCLLIVSVLSLSPSYHCLRLVIVSVSSLSPSRPCLRLVIVSVLSLSLSRHCSRLVIVSVSSLSRLTMSLSSSWPMPPMRHFNDPVNY